MKLLSKPLLLCLIILSLLQTGFDRIEGSGETSDACTGAPVISSPTVTGITSTGATLGGNITNAGSGGGCSLTERGVAFSTVSGEPATLAAPATIVVTAGTSTGVFTQAVTSLSPATQYFYVAYGKNSFGNSTTSEGSFFTLATEPSNHVTGFSVNSSTSSSITLTWTDATGGTLPTNYLIVARNSSGTFASVADGTSVADDTNFGDNNGALNIAQGVETATFSSLTPGTYFFEIYPYTGSAATINFKTTATVPNTSTTILAAEPTNHVTAFTVNSVTSNSIQLTWTDAAGAVPPSNYLIVARNSSGTFAAVADGTAVANDTNFGDDNGAQNIAQGVQTVTFSSLTSDSYFFEIYPYNGSGSTINFKTDGVVPSASATILASEPANHVTGFAVGTITSSSIQLTWTDASGSPSPTNYLVVARTTAGSFPAVSDGTAVANDTDFSDDNGALNVAQGVQQVTFTSLTQGETYFFEIYPYRGTGATINFKTSATVPNTSGTVLVTEPSNHVTGFAISAISDNSIQLSWTDASGATPPTNYIVLARSSSGTFASVSDGNPIADDTDFSNNNGALNVPQGTQTVSFSLSPATQYFFEIYPYRGSGSSINFKTSPAAPNTSGRTLSLEPAAHPTNFTATATSTTQISLAFSAANTITNAAGYAIFRRNDGADPTASAVTDGTAPASSGGNTLVTTITNTATTTFNDTGLTTGTQYNYAIIPFNWNGVNTSTYNYLTSATIKTDFDTPSNGVSITQASTTSVCAGSQVTLTDITIAEVAKADFSAGGTVFIELNDLAFSFVPAQGSVATNPAIGANTDITSIGVVVNASRITITFALDGNNNKKESITLSGIKVTYDGSVAPSAQLLRTGGTATIVGISATDMGTINSGSPAPAPVVSFTPSAYCQGDAISPGPNVTSNNTNVKWYTDAALTSEIVSLSGVTNINSPVLLTQLGFVTTNSGTITRYVTQQPGTCKSVGTAVTLTVQPKPVADIAITGGGSTLCTNFLNGAASHETVQFTASPSGATNYDFRINGVTTQSGASRILNRNASNFTTGNIVDVIVTVAGSCPSTSNAIVMTKNTATSAANFVVTNPPANSPNTISTFSNSEGPVNLTGTPSGGIFSGPGIVGNDFYPSGVPVGQHTITYTSTTNGCTDIKTRAFEVYSGATSILGLATSYCSTSPDFTMNVANSSIPGVPGATFLYILPLSNYSFNLLPLGSVRSENGTPGNFQEVTAANESNWFLGFSVTSSPIHISPSTITSTGNKTVQFYAVYRDNGTGSTITRTQNVDFFVTPPAPTAFLASGYCLGGPSILTEEVIVSGLTGAQFRWFNNSILTDERTSIAGNSSPTLLELGVSDGSPDVTLRYVTQTLNGCQSAPRTVTINVFAKPSAPTAPSPSAICSGGNFSDISATGTSVQWYTIFPTNPINPANPLLATATELGVPNTNLTTNPVSVTRFVTQTINGCTSDPTTVTFTINPIPAEPPVVNNAPNFCKNEDIDSSAPITVTSGTNIKWYRNNGPGGPSNQITPISNQFAPTAIELGLDSSIPGITNFFITQTVNSCESVPTLVTVTIIDLVSVNISVIGGQSLTGVCKTGSTVRLEASPGGGAWSGSAAAGLINIVAGVSTGIGTAELDPSNSNLLPGQNFNLTYTSTGGCANSDTKSVTVLPSINPSLTVGDACAGTFVDINNTSVVVPTGTATIDQIGYQFGDNGSIPIGSGIIPDGSDGGKTKGTYINPLHKYNNIGLFPVTYTMTTSDGCVVTGNQNIQISPVPQVNFSWRNACLGGSMEFLANISNGVTIPPGNFVWDFTKNNQLTFSAAGSGNNPTVDYNIVGSDIVELIVTSAANCKDTIQKPVFVVPVAAPITTNTPYSEDFNSGNGGWSSGGANPSWQYGIPSSTVINRDSSSTGTGGAWKTNLTGNNNANERSWVLSPCFDFTNASKPVASLDIWSNTPRGVDGAVLQYNVTGNLENEANWIVVGQTGSGINWYDQNNISSKPGNQASIDTGWTGDDNSTTKYRSWKRATFSLDGLVGQPSVNFRIAFAATVSGGEGFAFDNFLIGERSRTVLIENFTNTSAKAGQSGAKQQNDKYKTFKNSSTELVKIQYHTGFPGDDPIHDLNRNIYDARSAFYGLTSAPAARLDGQFKDGPFTIWGEPFYDDRVLDPTFLRIENIDAQKVDGVVKINTRLLATGQVPKNLFVHTVVVEKSITEPSLLGKNGDTELVYVVRDMLPSPEGHKITIPMASGDSYEVPEVVWSSDNLTIAGNGAIVVFVQQDTITSKAVYQAQIIMNPPHPDVITGIEKPNFKNGITIYPNPADHEITVALPAPATTRIKVQLSSQLGVITNETNFEAGQQFKVMDTSDITPGIYVLTLGEGTNTTRKKIMIIHK